MDKQYVLDTSAFLAFIQNEQGSDQVEEILSLAKHSKVAIYVSFMTFSEVYYTVYRKQGEHAAQETISLMNKLPIEKVHSNDVAMLSAGRIKANYRLSIADAFIAATAMAQKAVLIHKDPEFDSLADKLPVMKLPYKAKKIS